MGHIDLHDSDTAIALGKAMTRFENGVQPYSDDVVGRPAGTQIERAILVAHSKKKSAYSVPGRTGD